jgi:hypothetical protein
MPEKPETPTTTKGQMRAGAFEEGPARYSEMSIANTVQTYDRGQMSPGFAEDPSHHRLNSNAQSPLEFSRLKNQQFNDLNIAAVEQI